MPLCKLIIGLYFNSISCKHQFILRTGGKSEVKLQFNFNEQTNTLPLNQPDFLPNVSQLRDSVSAEPSTSLPVSLFLSLPLRYLLCRANLTALKSVRAGPGVAGRHMNIELVRQASLAYENTVMGAHRPQTEACTLN